MLVIVIFLRADRTDILSKIPALPVVVAIPAHNEAARLSQCLAALAVQRDDTGAPVAAEAFEILVFANNCTDGSADIARACGDQIPQRVIVVEERLSSDQSNAGWARKRAMDLASARLSDKIGPGIIMTTDADSCVSPTWFHATMTELNNGADCVAGYIDANAADIVALGARFMTRGRLEDTYLRLVAEIYAHCDPRPHDAWPNHRVSSGASLAVSRAAYLAIGGLPARPLGEDVAMTAALDDAGFKVRHSMNVSVLTSCRLDGRATGGAADTMRFRLENDNAPCDDDLESALALTRRAICRGLLRQAWLDKSASGLPRRLDVAPDFVNMQRAAAATFGEAWNVLTRESPLLTAREGLRPSDLPREISVAELILKYLRATGSPTIAPAKTHRRGELSESELA